MLGIKPLLRKREYLGFMEDIIRMTSQNYTQADMGIFCKENAGLPLASILSVFRTLKTHSFSFKPWLLRAATIFYADCISFLFL
jgi:hypothetical protein